MRDRHDEVQDLFDDESPEMHDDIEEKKDDFEGEEDFDDELEDDFDEDELEDEELDEDEPEEEKPRRPRKVSRDFDDEDENDELFTRKSNRGGNNFGGGNSYVKYGILAVGVIAVILLIILLFRGKSDGSTPESTGGVPADTVAADMSGETTGDIPAPTMAKDTNPEVGTLMNSFYTARQTADLSAMSDLVDSTANLSAQKLEKMKEYIEAYTGISCYTRDGLQAGEYLVYVYCDVKFLNIETTAPDLQWYYVKTAEDGHLYICTEMSQEENTFAQEQGALPEVRALVQDVNDRLASAMASDTGLDNLVKILNGEGDASGETPAAADTTAAPEGTTAAADTTSASETTAAPQTTSAAPASSDSITVWATDGPYAIRKEPSRDSEQIGSIYKGDHAARTELGSEWSKIEYVNAEGETVVGYVLNEALTTTSPE